MISGFPLILFICFIANAILALALLYIYVIESKPHFKFNRLIYVMIVSSFVWSFGMGMMSIQLSEQKAFFWRTFGILGTFVFMMTVQKIMCTISDIKKSLQIIANGISYTGLFIFLIYSKPGQTIFVQNKIGTTFYFKPGIVTIVYALYFVIVSTNILIVTIHLMKHHPRKQVRVAGRNFIIIEILIFIGSITDMFLPTLGYPALPGSALTHFWGLLIFWFAVHKMAHSEITISNMSEYIYYSLGIPVIIFDSNSNIKIMNDAALLFFKKDTVSIPNSINELFDVDDSIFKFNGDISSVKSYSTNANRNCEIAISKIYDSYNDVIGYITIINDLTDHEKVIEKLEQAKLAADSANMTKSLFLANMSHEIRTPLNAILGFSELALMGEVDDTNKEYFSNISQAGSTLLSIINQILDISKIELGSQVLNCTNYYPAQIIKDVELIIGVQAKKKGLDLFINLPESFPNELYGDKDRIREILINLLNNSVKYTESGSVTLNILSNINNDRSSVRIKFEISDTGIGIKEEDLPTIFDKFTRLDRDFNSKTEGIGLGLSITKGLVDLMGGTITVRSLYTVGSQFTVEIDQQIVDSTPVHLSLNDNEVTTSIIEHTLDDKSLKVLIVDDTRMNVSVIAKYLEKLGIEHDGCYSGFKAINLCQLNQYDIILLDQMMPQLDGIETLKAIKCIPGYDSSTSCKFIAFTANAISGTEEKLLKEGFDEYLPKPISLKSLEKILFTDIL